MFRTPLLRLPNIMLLLRPQLRIPIPRHARHRPPNRTRNPIRDPTPIITQLALRLLRLALRVLLPALLLQVLGPDQPAQGFLAGAERLVPGAFAAVRIVSCDGAGGGGGEGPEFGGCVAGFVFELGFGFLGFAGVLEVR